MDHRAHVDAWMKQGKETFAGFARAVRERFKEMNHGSDPRGKPRSFDPQMRRWYDGDYDFGVHPDRDALRQAIADVLEVDVEVVFPREASNDPALLPIESFALLGAFDARHEEPCITPALVVRHTGAAMAVTDGFRPPDRFDWLRPRHRRPAWVHVPPGAGQSFVAHWHRHHWKHQPWDPNDPSRLPPSVHVVDKLEELDALRWPPESQLMVVEVHEAGTDDGVLTRLRQHSAMVIAPFACPRPTTVDGYPNGWMIVEWSPDVRWRRDFVAWVAARLKRLGLDDNSLLTEKAFVTWIDAVDPRCRLFDTPEALLGLLHFAHERGESKLAQSFGPELARMVLSAQLGRHQEDTTRGRWLRESAAAVVERVIAGGWGQPQLPWGRALRSEQWASLVPGDVVGSVDGGREEAREIRAKLKRKVTAAKRKELEEKLDEVLARPASAAEVVWALRQARLLRPYGVGTLQFAPGWVAAALVRGETERMIRDGDLAKWGRLAVDPTRRHLVDAALTKLDWEVLAQVATRALHAHRDSPTLGTLGAVEAIFLAVGTKLCNVEMPTTLRARFAGVAALQVELLVPHYPQGMPAPRTRPGVNETGGAAFLAAGWAWSLDLPCPDVPLPEEVAWLFPGWARPALDHLSDDLTHHEGRALRGPLADVEEDGVYRLASIAPFVLDVCPGSLPERHTPWFLVVAAIARAVRRGWDFDPLVRSLPRPWHILTRVEHEVRALPDDLREQTLDGIWRALLAGRSTPEDLLLGLTSPGAISAYNGRLLDWEEVLSPLDARLRARLPLDALQARIRSEALWTEERVELLLARAPRASRNALARTFLDLPKQPGVLSPAIAGVTRAALQRPDEMFDVLVDIADDPHHAHDVVPLLWRTRPELVRERAVSLWRDRGSTDPWVSWGSEDAFESVLAVFEAVPERPLTPALLPWLSRRLVEVGALADRVWALLERDRRRASP